MREENDTFTYNFLINPEEGNRVSKYEYYCREFHNISLAYNLLKLKYLAYTLFYLNELLVLYFIYSNMLLIRIIQIVCNFYN